MAIMGLLSSLPPSSSAQSQEVQQLLLNVEKLSQFKQILDDMKRGYQILDQGYSAIRNLSEGSFTLHEVFLDGLMQVSPAVRRYHKIAEIVECQVRMVKEYKRSFRAFKMSRAFAPEELAYMSRVYDRLLQESLRNLDEFAMVVTAGKMRMSDDERLRAIDRIYKEMLDKMVFLKHFDEGAALVARQRANLKVSTGHMQELLDLSP